MKCAIITITNGSNYGNRLQNYAVQRVLEKRNITVETLINLGNNEDNYKTKIKSIVKNVLKTTLLYKKYNNEIKRLNAFKKFNKYNIRFSKNSISNTKISTKILKQYDCFICGSDQIWNPNYKENAKVNFLGFVENRKKIAYAPSFGVSNIPDNRKEEIKNWLNKIDYLSVRENEGKKIIEELTNRKDVEILLDPTMMLTSEEWDKISKKPNQLKNDKYILNYFLGELSEERRKQIDIVAKENNCEIINILDKNSPFYQTDPSEFLYLEKNAFLICTDSFHSCVFAIIYNRPFVVFDREDNTVSMNSRIETLLNKFMLQDRKYNGKLTEEQLKHNYENAYKILEKEKQKAYNFLNTALDIKENEIERK